MGDIKTRFSIEGEQQYKSAMTNAYNAVKVLNAEEKLAAAQFKQTGDAEQYAATKAQILQQKITQQKAAVEAANKALAELSKNHVPETSRQFQQWQTKLLSAQTSLANMETELNGLNGTMGTAAAGAEKLSSSLNGISRKISLDQVVSGISAITTGLENAAKRAVDFGEKLFDVIMDSAAQADDISTLATRLGLTTEEVQRMQYVAARFEAPVEEMGKTWQRVKTNMASDSDEIAEGFKKLGVATHEMIGTPAYGGQIKGAARDYLDVFWETGEALMQMSDESEQARLAQQLLGRSWTEWIPLFKAGRQAYEEALAAAPVASEEAIDNLAELNDRMSELESSWNTLKLQTLQSIAPALTAGADALAKVLDSVTAYLQTDPGQEMLTNLGNAVSALFEDLGSIDPEKVVQNFSTLFEGVVNSFEWLKDNWGDVKNALIGIAAGFGVLKIATLALNIGKVVNGLGDLLGRGGTPAAPAAPSAAPIAGPGAGAGEQIGTWMRLGVSSVGQWIGKAARGLSMYDPTGATALVPQVIEDRTTLGWELAHGASIGEAAGKSWETIKASAKEGMDNLTRYFSAELPNAFWGIFGFKSAEDAAAQVTKVAEQTKKNMEAADAYTFDEHMSIDEIMAMMNGDKPAEVKVVPKASITFNEDLLKQLGPFVIPANVAIVGIDGLSGVQMNSAFSGMGFGRGGNATPGITPANFSSNLYVENMNMNNGIDAAGLAARMAEAQRRISAGYGN